MIEASGFESIQVPFNILVVTRVFGGAENIDAMRQALCRQQGWVRQTGPAHDFWSLPDLSGLRESLRPYRSRFEAHRLALQQYLGVVLSNPPSFDVFRLSDGDGIGFHDDAHLKFARMVVRIGPEKSKTLGGEFVVSCGRLNTTHVIELEVDIGVAFSLGPGKMHALSNVRGPDVTYLIVQFGLGKP